MLKILVCKHDDCGRDMIMKPGDMPTYCEHCGRLGHWRHLSPAEVTEWIKLYVARLEVAYLH